MTSRDAFYAAEPMLHRASSGQSLSPAKFAMLHRYAVEQAVRRRLDVPAEVLAEYPELRIMARDIAADRQPGGPGVEQFEARIADARQRGSQPYVTVHRTLDGGRFQYDAIDPDSGGVLATANSLTKLSELLYRRRGDYEQVLNYTPRANADERVGRAWIRADILNHQAESARPPTLPVGEKLPSELDKWLADFRANQTPDDPNTMAMFQEEQQQEQSADYADSADSNAQLPPRSADTDGKRSYDNRLTSIEKPAEVTGPGELRSASPLSTGNTISIRDFLGVGKSTPSAESADELNFQADPAPPFFLKSRQLLETKLPGSGAVRSGDVRGMLAGQVKAEELKWTGLDDLLSEPDRRLTRKQVLDHLAANDVRIREVVKDTPTTPLLDSAARSLYGQPYAELSEQRQENVRAQVRGTAEEDDILSPAIGEMDRPRFSPYVLRGGRHYRELLLTMPRRSQYAARTVDQLAREMGYRDGWTNGIPAAEQHRILREFRRIEGMDFRSKHWDEPNVLAHVRFNERTDADGRRVLFIEEIQSDWHQKGRRKGYQTDLDAMLTPEERELREFNSRSWQAGNEALTNADLQRAANLQKRVGPSLEAKALQAGKGVPDAPFKTTWHELALKRMIRWAAEHGFDSIAWTTGQQQAGRYDLSKQISRVTYTTGGQVLRAYDLNGSLVVNRHLTASETVADYIGKEAADRLLASPEVRVEQDSLSPKGFPGHELSGIDLKVGGEGMSWFYDRMLVEAASKIGRKFASQVGQTQINTSISRNSEAGFGQASETVHALPITAAMRVSVMTEGQPLFHADRGKGGRDHNFTEAELAELEAKYPTPEKQLKRRNYLRNVMNSQAAAETRARARAELLALIEIDDRAAIKENAVTPGRGDAEAATATDGRGVTVSFPRRSCRS